MIAFFSINASYAEGGGYNCVAITLRDERIIMITNAGRNNKITTDTINKNFYIRFKISLHKHYSIERPQNLSRIHVR